MRRVLIVGATSSLATSLARKLAAVGVDLVLAGRDVDELHRLQADMMIRTASNVEVLVLDLLDTSIDMNEFAAACGELDGVFIFAGYMGDDNAITQKNITEVAMVNYSQVACLTAALSEHMQDVDGTITVVSSVAGDRGRASNFVYGSAKAGLTAFLSGLRAQLSQAGSKLHIMTVKPGFVDTPMTYAMNSGLTVGRGQVANEILKAAKKKKNSIYTPKKWWLIMTIITHIPERIFKRLKF